MELWIRSQDKTILSKTQNIIIRENKNENNETNYAIVDIYTMGIYNSKERALEVLDEIEAILMYDQLEKITGNAFIKVNNGVAIYEMPKE